MRPYIICHMLSAIDGRIDANVLEGVMRPGDYEATAKELRGDGWICGRTTMQQHFAEQQPFVSAANKAAGPRPLHVARDANSYAISVDTTGRLSWASGEIDGDHLICVVSEQAPEDYLAMLEEKAISYIVAGETSVDLGKTVDLLGTRFGIRTLLLEGGGHINGSFLQASLVDEISLIIVPGVDGRRGVPTVFDGIGPSGRQAVPLKLKSVQQLDGGSLWIRYEVYRP